MDKIKKLVVIRIGYLFALAFFVLLISPGVVTAGTEHNTRGWAWSGTVGWVSFNSLDCDSDNNGFVDVTCNGDNSTIIAHNYGVNIEPSTGDFSGYAWSDNVGWIYFGPDADLGAPYGWVQESGAPLTADNPQAWGNFDGVSGQITGWAKILSLGADGWISLADDNAGDGFGYGLSGDSVSGDLSGWAWNGNDDNSGIGWISFNSIDCDFNNDGLIDNGNCGTIGGPIASYKVTSGGLNSPPTVSIDGTVFYDQFMCGEPSARYLHYQLQWSYSDIDSDPQAEIHLIVNDGLNDVLDIYSSQAGQTFPLRSLDYAWLDFGETYTWSISVSDGTAWSGWDISGAFSTPENPYPIPRFYWAPYQINEDENIWFVARESGQTLSQFYPDTPLGSQLEDCDGASCAFTWSVSDPAKAIIDNAAAASTFIRFNDRIEEAEGISIELNLDHDIHEDGTVLYSCSSSSVPLKTYLPLPIWVEN